MVSRVATAAVVGVLVLGAGAVVGLDTGLFAPNAYDRTAVTLEDANGTRLATVDVRVADTPLKRYTGLSDTNSLDDGEGMLFVHDDEGMLFVHDDEATHTYVMRDMDFSLDIVFVAENGTVTTIQHAPVPSETEGDDLVRYPGYGTYVLEVPRGYANATGLDVGDRVVIPDGVAARTPTETSS